MNEKQNLTVILQMIEAAEKNLATAKSMLQQIAGGSNVAVTNPALFATKAKQLDVTLDGKIIEGVFDGQNMIGPDGKQYPVPANYASKSKLIEGDVLKLSIAENGSFIYKQIGPVERKKIIGVLTQDEKGDYKVLAEGRSYKVLLASLTYFKAEAGDQITIIVPEDGVSEWAAVENVVKNAHAVDSELMLNQNTFDADEELQMNDASVYNAQAPSQKPDSNQPEPLGTMTNIPHSDEEF